MSAVLKKGRASQRLRLHVQVGTSLANLSGVTLEAKIATTDEVTSTMISGALEPQSGATLGHFYVDIATANLTAIGNPSDVLVVWNLWNADNSLFMWGRAPFPVVL